MRSGILFAFSWAVALLGSAGVVHAHQGLHELITAKTREIEQEPVRAELYLERGELHRQHADWDAAMADYERARQRDPNLHEVDLARAKLMIDLNWLQSAELVLREFLQQEPKHAKGYELLGQTLENGKQYEAAAGAYARAIEVDASPRPELYLARARVLAAWGDAHLGEAVAVLDAGINRLGQPLATLQLAAIDYEVRRGRHDSALERLKTLSAQAERQERWLILRGEILAQAGRSQEAIAAYQSAIRAMDALHPVQRNTTLVLALRSKATKAIETLTTPVHKEADEAHAQTSK